MFFRFYQLSHKQNNGPHFISFSRALFKTPLPVAKTGASPVSAMQGARGHIIAEGIKISGVKITGALYGIR